MVDQVSEQVQENVEQAKPSFDLGNFVQTNRNALIIAVVAIVVAVLGVSYYRSVQSAKELEASLALSRISPYVEANDYEKALNGDPSKKMRGSDIIGLLAIIDQYGSTGAGKTAALEAGIAEMALNKFDAAEQHFEAASGSESDVVRASAIAGTAACLEHKSQYADAAKTYEKAIAISDKISGKDKYSYYAALCFEKANDKESAIKWYKNLILEFEYSEFSSEARAGLTRLGTVVD